MSQAVHVANPTVSTALSKLLEFLHQQKKQRGVRPTHPFFFLFAYLTIHIYLTG